MSLLIQNKALAFPEASEQTRAWIGRAPALIQMVATQKDFSRLAQVNSVASRMYIHVHRLLTMNRHSNCYCVWASYWALK